MRKISNSTGLFAICAATGIAFSISILTPQSGCAQERIQPSLVESALDGNYNEQTVDGSGQASTSPQTTQASSSNNSSHPKKKKKEESAAVDPNHPVVKSVPPQRKLDENIPEPQAVMDPPIHSRIPAGEKSILKIPMGVKVGKSSPVDMTYRGKPTIPSVSTVTFGSPSWAIPQKKQIAGLSPALTPATSAPITLSPASRQTPAAPVTTPAIREPAPSTVAGQPATPASNTVNFRFLTESNTNHFRPTDSIWLYPYPPKPPKPIEIHPLPEDEATLKSQLLSFGYSARPDPTKPYPLGGVRWLRAFENARHKANTGYPHTMLTMYPWVNKMYPYILSECLEMNRLEEQRMNRYQQVLEDYERIHVDLESQATARGLVPIEVKVNPRGIGQIQMPSGNWWVAATRKLPGLKFYWQVPISCTENQTINIQLNESNALIIGGGW